MTTKHPPIPEDGLRTYELACQMARDGHEGLRAWFRGDAKTATDVGAEVAGAE